MRLALLVIISLLTLGTAATAQDAAPPTATIADAAWLAGAWEGEGMGGTFQQGVARPVAGQMSGYFTLVRGDKVAMHQLLLFEEFEGSLRLRVKHFGADLVGVEDKDQALDIPLLAFAPGQLTFRGMVFRQDGADRMILTIHFRTADGAGRNDVLRYRRVP